MHYSIDFIKIIKLELGCESIKESYKCLPGLGKQSKADETAPTERPVRLLLENQYDQGLQCDIPVVYICDIMP